MSRSSSIDIRYHSYGITSCEVLKMLLSYGWNLDDYGEITFLPMDDDDRFDWMSLPYTMDNQRHVLQLLEAKERAQELLGITLQWENSRIGGTVLFYSDQSFSFMATVNRRKLPMFEFTDVNWYLHKLLAPLLENNVVVELIQWSEHV